MKRASFSADTNHRSLLKQLLLFMVPMMITHALQLLFNTADLVTASRLAGADAMAAIGATTSLISLTVQLFNGLAVGPTVLAARDWGAWNLDELRRTVHTTLALALIIGPAFSLVGIVSAEKLLLWMRVPPAILPQSALYLRIYFLGLPAVAFFNLGTALLRALGDTRRPLRFLLPAAAVNAVLNFILAPLFSQQVAGIAAATTLSQFLAAGLLLRHLLREQGPLRLEPRRLRLHRDKLGRLLRIGIPSGLQVALFSISNVVIQSAVNAFGETVVAGNSASASLENLVFCIDISLGTTVLSFTARAAGSGQRREVFRILATASCFMAAVAACVVIVCQLGGEHLLLFYTDSPAVLQIALIRLRIVSASYVLTAMIELMVGSLRGMGYSLLPMIVSLLGVCGFRLGWIATVFQLPQYHTITSLYISYPISWAVTLLTHILVWCIAVRRLQPQAATPMLPA